MTPRIRLALWVTGTVAGLFSAIVVASSDRTSHPVLTGVLIAVVGWAFIVGGLIALERRPDNRFGLLMAAEGFAWFAATLGASDEAWVFSVGYLMSSLYLAVLGHTILAYPTGRLQDRASRTIVTGAYLITTLGTLFVVLLARPADLHCTNCPENRLIAFHSPGGAQALNILLNSVGLVLCVAAVVLLARRWRAATPAARHLLAPVLGTGAVVIAALGVQTALQLAFDLPMAQLTTNLIFGLIPLGFMFGLLRSGLARSSAVGGLIQDIGRSSGSPEAIRAALGATLNDPGLSVAYWIPEKEQFVDADGVPVFDPAPGSRRTTTAVEYHGAVVARLEHDIALADDPDLLQAACAAAGLALANARLTTELRARLKELGASERRWRELLEGVNLIAVSLDLEGRIQYANPFLAELTGWERDELIGRDWLETFNPEEREYLERMRRADVLAYEENFVTTRTGERRTIAWSNTVLRDADGSVVGATSIGADITDRRTAERALRALLVEHTALERVARLVAEGRSRHIVFERVTEEAGRLLSAASCNLVRFRDDGTGLVFGGWGEPGANPILAGSVVALDDDSTAARVHDQAGPVRVDSYAELEGDLAQRVRETGIRSAIGAPIMVGGSMWGALVAFSLEEGSFPDGAEHRLAAFAGLVGLAIANADAREQLAASRARIVAAGDAERRRLERNLHDGAQQRLVSLSLALRLARSQLKKDPATAEDTLAAASDELNLALAELRDLARGIHPAVLSDRGLRPALEGLTLRMNESGLDVEVEDLLDQRLPEQVEVAAYYVVAESLANVTKYAAADRVSVRVMRENGRAVVEVQDDGRGGADPGRGSGLRGLLDRIEALDGRLSIQSPPGGGTTIRAEIPCA
jgi:PAS domain S-box-containing protein